MKNIKKVFTFVITLAMVLMMSIPAFAAADDTTSITIDGAVDGSTYTAYKLMDATYDGNDATAIAYYYTGAATDELYTILAKYFQFDNFRNGKAYVKVKDGDTAIDYSNVNVAALAAEINTAMNREQNPLTLTPADSVIASNGQAVISNLAKGYYFVDTTTGSLCSIGTAKNVTIYEKNSVPTVTDKQVKADGAPDTAYAESVSGTVGDKFNFRITVNTGTNTNAPDTSTGRDTNFVVTDTLGKGFTLATAANAFVVKYGTTTLTYGTDYTVALADAADATKDTTITVTLLAATLATIPQDTNIFIEYDATLNENAISDGPATNNADGQITKTYTYSFDVLKVDGENAPLEGVKFTLTDADGNNYYFVPSDASSVDEDVMKPLGQGQDGKIATASDGKITFSGLAAGTYILTETDTLEGFNLLDGPLTVTITPNTDPATAIVEVTGEATASGTTITVVNQSGTVLPGTGGIGTTIFYVLGSLLVIGCGIVLVSRKRMQNNK